MSLFDAPKLKLNPVLWEADGNHLKPEVGPYLIQLLEKIYPMTKVSSLVMIGSSVGHQYSDTSDIDVNVSAVKGEEFDTWHKIFKNFNNIPNYYPGTQHPINFFFQEYTSSNDWSNSLGAYDILQNEWSKRPIPFDKIGDPKEKFRSEIQYANMVLNLIDYEVKSMEELAARGQKEETQERLFGLAIMFKNIEDNRKAAYRYRAGTPALQEYNAVYKLIEGSRHKELFERLIRLYDEDWQIKQAGFIRDIKDDASYGWYVTKHKANIVSPMIQMGLPVRAALAHDLSKYRPSEFRPYARWFKGPKGLTGTNDPETYKKWRGAVDLHYARNAHHFHKQGIPVEQVPLKTRMEAVADWYSVGKTNRPKNTVFPSFRNWYASHEKGLPVDPVAKAEIASQLKLTKEGNYNMTRSEFIMQKIATINPDNLAALKDKWGAIDRLTAFGEHNYNRLNSAVGKTLIGRGISPDLAYGINDEAKREAKRLMSKVKLPTPLVLNNKK